MVQMRLLRRKTGVRRKQIYRMPSSECSCAGVRCFGGPNVNLMRGKLYSFNRNQGMRPTVKATRYASIIREIVSGTE